MSGVRGARARARAATLPAIAAEDDIEADGAGGALQGGLHASGAQVPGLVAVARQRSRKPYAG